MGSLIYLIGAAAVFIGTITFCVATARANDTAGEIVGLAFVLAFTWPLAATAGLVWLTAAIVLGPFVLLTNAVLRHRA